MEDRFHDRELLRDLFDAVIEVMRGAKGTRHSVGSENYVDAAKVRSVVDEALRKVECESLDHWRRLEQEEKGNA